MCINVVTPAELSKIIENFAPLGKYICYDVHPIMGACYIGCDNEDGNCWVEEFKTLQECIEWL